MMATHAAACTQAFEILSHRFQNTYTYECYQTQRIILVPHRNISILKSV